ncbi:transglycosylase domain-containing protein [Paenibacillus gansuensis]|uniref:Transglycosylase domain-containing protein n=1 Tax=Paenibacillus gansuensis TaxID=306542 RepID=A0ABW5PID8_9BACL
MEQEPKPVQTELQDQGPYVRMYQNFKKGVTVLLLTGGIVIGLAVLALLFLRTQSLPAASVSQTSQIFDANGTLIDSFHSGQNRQVIPLRDISPYLKNATLAIEDNRFYSHWGIDMRGLARAVAVDVKHMAKVQGASTITQQLARNLYLNHDRTWERKIKEAMYTVQLEMNYSKDEILEKYLNQIYYGHSTYGAETAAQVYFGKHAKDLSLAESALLAGVPKGPKYYSPYLDLDNALSRQKTVLQSMVKYGYLTQSEAEAAAKEPLNFKPLSAPKPDAAPYFRDYVKQFAVTQLGIDEKLIDGGGLKIYTSLDMKAQEVAEKAVAGQLQGTEELQAALISIDPRNGYIKAMVGGRDYDQNQYNRVFAGTRQPGSAFKAFLYLAALESKTFSPMTKFKSEPTTFTYDNGKQTYTPRNYGGHYENDWIDMRQAIAKSDNIYAVSTIQQVGPEKVIETARKLGVDSAMKPLPSLALGTFPVSPFEMAVAYGTISNRGVKVTPTAVLKVVDSEGRVLYESHPQAQQAADPAAAYVLTNLMQSVFEEGGTGNRVSRYLKRPVAGKSGTTNSDAWMVGFTPELVTAVWVGHDKGKTITTVESRKAAPIFAEYTEGALESIPPKLFEMPQDVVSVYVDTASGKLATASCGQSRLEVFVKGTEPAEYCGDGGKPLQPTEERANHSWWQDLKRWWTD